MPHHGMACRTYSDLVMGVNLNAYFDGLRRYVDFAGRSTPRQFWLFMLVLFVAIVVGVFLDGAAGDPSGGGIVATLIGLAHVIPTWAVTARRLHDTGRSGWLSLLSLVPIVGAIVLIVMCCGPSQPGPNQFGEPVASADPARSHPNAYRQADLPFEPSMNPQRYPAASTTPASAPIRAANAPRLDEGALIERLERLAALKASGAIDDAEFASMKASTLERYQPAHGAQA